MENRTLSAKCNVTTKHILLKILGFWKIHEPSLLFLKLAKNREENETKLNMQGE